MFANSTRRFGRIVLGALALPAALCCVAGAAPAPDHDDWGRGRDRDRFEHRDSDRHDRIGLNVGVVLGWPQREVIVRDRPVVISQPPVVISQPVVVRTYQDVVPAQLGFAAYHSRDTVILVVTGANAGNGFSTSLTGADCSGWTPSVTMRNTPTCEINQSVTAPFSLTASLRVTHAISSVRVNVAGQAYDVPVVEAPSLS